MIDMHIHTLYSDGNDSVQEIFKMANKLNLSTISITDHNTIEAYEEIINKDLINCYKGNLVTGVELKCHINKEIIELLVYDFNIDKMKVFIQENCYKWEYINKSMTTEFEKLLIDLDISYDKNIMVKHNFTKYNGIMELYKSVIEIKDNEKKLGEDLYKDIPEFTRKSVCNKNSRFYIDLSKYYPSIEMIVNFLQYNEGKLFMPHVYLFNNGFNILKQLKNEYRLDGVECYYPSYTNQQCDELFKYCRDNNLYISAGSDYHSSNYEFGFTSKFYDDTNIKLFEFKNLIKRK